MKKIYVTIDEFIKNGGDLEPGRPIYTDNRALKIGGFTSWFNPNKEYININESDWPIPITLAQVQVECVVIYK